jgi:hypothetical protein
VARVRVATAALWAATVVLVVASAAGQPLEADRLAGATRLFTQYVNLEKGYWPAVGDLFADDAVIKNTRRYPNGEVRQIPLTAPQYRELLKQAMPLAKARGDRSTYSDVMYTADGPHVRISAQRFSELKRYTSPFSLLVGRREDGRWLILEETSESQP